MFGLLFDHGKFENATVDAVKKLIKASEEEDRHAR
jgi:hypothetical protein